MNGTDVFGLFTGGLGVLGFLWSLAQWLSPYTRISALQCTIQQLDRLVDEVTTGGGRLHVGVMGEIWERYHRIHKEYHHLRVHTLIPPSFLHTAKLVVACVPQKITRLDHDARTLHDDINYERDIARLRSAHRRNVQVFGEI